jgi:hypothetical protein
MGENPIVHLPTPGLPLCMSLSNCKPPEILDTIPTNQECFLVD